MTAIPLGRKSPSGSVLPTRQLRGATSSLAYLALLRAEIARFTRTEPARLCCSDPHLAVERCYLLRCPVQSGRSSDAVFPRLRQRRSGRLYAAHCRHFRAAWLGLHRADCARCTALLNRPLPQTPAAARQRAVPALPIAWCTARSPRVLDSRWQSMSHAPADAAVGVRDVMWRDCNGAMAKRPSRLLLARGAQAGAFSAWTNHRA